MKYVCWLVKRKLSFQDSHEQSLFALNSYGSIKCTQAVHASSHRNLQKS